MTAAVVLAPFALGAVVLAIAQQRTINRLREQLTASNVALSLQLARRQGEQRMRELTADWERHVEMEGLEFADGDDAAHAFADFLANQTGETIVAQRLDGDGVIVAIPDDTLEAT